MRRALLVTVALAAVLPAVAPAGIFDPVARKSAPALAGTDPVTGKHVRLAQWQGKPLLVHLWGSWCHPCREEAPVLRAFLAHHPRSVLGIDVEDSKAGARSYFLDRHHRIVAVVYEPATAAQLARGWKLATR
jgi:thiol-disulfide isomerase/thioredoxin